MTQNSKGENYTLYQEYTDLSGVIGKSYSADLLNIDGFTYDHATANGTKVTASGSKVSGTVASTGLEIIIYYNRNMYPYEFRFSIIYELDGPNLAITYKVQNKDEKEMYFGVGGHPGFNVPLSADECFEDYYLEFESKADVKRVGFSEDCFVTGELLKFEWQDGVKLPLHHNLFDDDAIVLTDMARSIVLASEKSGKKLIVSYPNMKYLGIWHMPKTDAPYVCIEPWSSLPSRKGIVEDLSTQPDLIHLESGCEYENQICIRVC
jgi:galactose mutarotase-like enzyme